MYDLLKQTEQTVTSYLSREPSDLDPPCFQKRFNGTNEHIAQVPLVLVYDQIFQISTSKQSRPWSGSSHESCFISICIVYKNVLKLQHEFIAQVPLVYDQIFRISISKQKEAVIRQFLREPLDLDPSCLQKSLKPPHEHIGSTCVWSDISYPHKQT